MKHQVWYCDGCRALGVVAYEEGSGAYDVITRLREEHQRASGSCVEGCRVINLSAIKETTILMRGQ